MGTICQRVEKHMIRQRHKYYKMLHELCHLSKNLYNHANYEIRQAFIKEGKWLRYEEIDRILKADKEYPDYAAMPTAQSAQQTLRILDRNWKSWFASLRDWREHKDKYRGKPRMPGYLKKDGAFQLTLTSQNCRLKKGMLCFPRVFGGFTVTPAFTKREDFRSFQQARLIPHKNRIVIELVYNIEVPDKKEDKGR